MDNSFCMEEFKIMATFSIALKDAVEVEPSLITKTLAEYPIFDENYRGHLNQMILDQFWNQEIGQETISMFQLALKRKLNQIMTIHNQQYLINQIKFDPLQTVNVKNLAANAETTTKTGETTTDTTGEATTDTTGGKTTDTTGESTTDSTSAAKSRAVSQELPQTMLSGNGDYATAAQDNISDTTAGAASTEAGTAITTETGNAVSAESGTAVSAETSSVSQDGTTESSTVGFQGNPAMMILQYRQSLVNVDMMVLDDLKELFMLIWSNGDEFSPKRGMYFGYFGYYG